MLMDLARLSGKSAIGSSTSVEERSQKPEARNPAKLWSINGALKGSCGIIGPRLWKVVSFDVVVFPVEPEPRQLADWWDHPSEHVLGGRDLERSERGTWLGITRQGCIACLTNFRESDPNKIISGLKSRGGIVNSFLKAPPDSTETTADSAKRLIEGDGVMDVGGFSLLFGRLRKPGSDGHRDPLAIISNRTPDVHGVTWVAGESDEIYGLSNSHFGDQTWPKVTRGEEMLRETVKAHAETAGSNRDQLIDGLLDVLSTDTLPKKKVDEAWDTFVMQLRNSIFIPRVGGEVAEMKNDEVAGASTTQAVRRDPQPSTSQGIYATHKQSVILVDDNGHVTFVEKTLYATEEKHDDSEHDMRKLEFDIEGW